MRRINLKSFICLFVCLFSKAWLACKQWNLACSIDCCIRNQFANPSADLFSFQLHTTHDLQVKLFVPLCSHYDMNQTKPDSDCLWCSVAFALPGTLWSPITTGLGLPGILEMFKPQWHMWHRMRAAGTGSWSQ